MEAAMGCVRQHRAVLGACLAAAHRTGHLTVNPTTKLLHVPSKGESDHGIALDEEELATFVAAYRLSPLFPIVALTAATGARRNEVLALRWRDLDVEKKTLRIERAIDRSGPSEKFKLGVKPPKTARGKRTIDFDDTTVAMLVKGKEQHLRIAAGAPMASRSASSW
jgi:integrase